MAPRTAVIAIMMLMMDGIAPAIAYETKLDGFQGTRWGMSEREVQGVFNGQLTYWTKEGGDGKDLQHFGIRRYEVDGCKFYADFEFNSGNLSRVSLNLDDDRQIECLTKMGTLITGKYGQPTSDESETDSYGVDSRHRNWFIGVTRIGLHQHYFRPLSSAVMSIVYTPSRTAGSGKL